MSGNIEQIVDVQVAILAPAISKDGFGIAAILYSREAAITGKRVLTFTDPSELLESTDMPELTETSPVYLMAVAHYNVSNQDFKPTSFKVILRDTTASPGADESEADALTAATVEDNNFYVVHQPERGIAGLATNKAVGDWCKMNTKCFITTSDDIAIRDDAYDPEGTDLADYFQGDGNGRAFIIYNSHAGDYPECTLSGRNLPNDPGSVNWKFTQYKAAVDDELSTTQRVNLDGDGDLSIESKNTNYIQKIAGVTFLSSAAILADGLFIDIRRGADWITAEQSADVLALLLSVKKVPNTNDGRTLVENAMRKSMDLAVRNGVIQAGYTIYMPDESVQSDGDGANRWLDDVTWEAKATGGLNKVIIRGSLYI